MAISYPAHDFVESNVEFRAQVAECSCTYSSDVFSIYWPEGSNHPHIQCVQCEQSYCLSPVPCLIAAVLPEETNGIDHSYAQPRP